MRLLHRHSGGCWHRETKVETKTFQTSWTFNEKWRIKLLLPLYVWASCLVCGWVSECWWVGDQQGSEEADHVEIHWGAKTTSPAWLFEKEPKLYASVAGWGDILRKSNRVVFMNIIRDSDQKINGMYTTMCPMPLFEHKSNDKSAHSSFLASIVYRGA